MIRIDVAAFDRGLAAAPWGGAIHAAWRRLAPAAAPDGVPLAALDRLARLRSLRSGGDRALRFVAADSVAPDAYEVHIARTGEVPTRTDGPGALHDLLNALAWLAWPGAKARLNAVQAAVIEREGIGGRRGAARDAATLFDENAALFVTRDEGLGEALRSRDWRGLFLDRRAAFAERASVRLFGHALVQKLFAPYKAICAHAWMVPLPADAPDTEVDAWLAARFAQAGPSLEDARPLPVLGIPGWWPANEEAGFYADESVFRPPSGRAGRGAPGRVSAAAADGRADSPPA